MASTGSIVKHSKTCQNTRTGCPDPTTAHVSAHAAPSFPSPDRFARRGRDLCVLERYRPHGTDREDASRHDATADPARDARTLDRDGREHRLAIALRADGRAAAGGATRYSGPRDRRRPVYLKTLRSLSYDVRRTFECSAPSQALFRNQLIRSKRRRRTPTQAVAVRQWPGRNARAGPAFVGVPRVLLVAAPGELLPILQQLHPTPVLASSKPVFIYRKRRGQWR